MSRRARTVATGPALWWAAWLCAAVGTSGCGSRGPEEPTFPEQVDEQCRTRPGCQQLFTQLSQKRDFCFREYDADDRPEDCDENDMHWWALKDHIELIELRSQRHADACREQAAEMTKQRQQLAQQRQQWRQEREHAARIDKTWQQLEPRKCAIEGNEEACYQLVRFIALGPNPHHEEAKAALASGQRLIDERQRRAGKRPRR